MLCQSVMQQSPRNGEMDAGCEFRLREWKEQRLGVEEVVGQDWI